MPRTSGPRRTGSSAKSWRARWTVTCTRAATSICGSLASERGSVHLSYHGLDLDRFGPVRRRAIRARRLRPAKPVTIAQRRPGGREEGLRHPARGACAAAARLHWRFEHIGGGENSTGSRRWPKSSASPTASPGTARWRRRRSCPLPPGRHLRAGLPDHRRRRPRRPAQRAGRGVEPAARLRLDGDFGRAGTADDGKTDCRAVGDGRRCRCLKG